MKIKISILLTALAVLLLTGLASVNTTSADDGDTPPQTDVQQAVPPDPTSTPVAEPSVPTQLPSIPPNAMQLPTLGVGQHYGRQVVRTPDGNVTIEYGDESTAPMAAIRKTRGVRTAETIGDNSNAQASDVVTAVYPRYYRSCWAAATGALWQIKTTSTFQYDYHTLWQQPPRTSVRNVLPYWWSDLRAWNSYWTYTVRFANGQGVLHAGVGSIGMAVTYHISIQEDAWGNCKPNVWRS